MIRKLKSGQYRLYSRKRNPRTHKEILERSTASPRRRNTSGPCNFSNTADRARDSEIEPNDETQKKSRRLV
jgi:hypothetical protein